MAYTSDKKPGALNQAVTLGNNDNLVIEQSGNVNRATLSQFETKVFDAKTAITVPNGTEAVVVRQTDNTLRQVTLANIVPAGNINNDKVSASAAISDTKLDTISTAGKVTNSATTATSNNINNAIVARDGSGNFSAGTVTATLAGSITGSAPTLATGRTISLTGDVTGTTGTFNGSADVSAATTIANAAVTTVKIADANVTTAKIADVNVTTAKIADVNVTTAKIADANVTTAKIADANVTTAKIADANVTTAKIADDAVTADKLDGVADIDTKTADYTLVLADAGRVIEFNSASNLTLTVPTNATVAFATGTTIVVTRRGTGDVTVAGPGVDLRSGGSKLKIGQQYAGIALIKIGTDEWMVLGDLKS